MRKTSARLKNKGRKIFWTAFIVLAIVGVLVFEWYGKGYSTRNTKVGSVIVEKDLDLVFGKDSAQLTVFMYSSYQCGFCRRFFNEVYPELKLNYIDKSKVRLVVKLVDFTNNNNIHNALKTMVCINKFGNSEMLHRLLLSDPSVVFAKEFVEVTEEFIQKDEFVAECMLNGNASNYLDENSSNCEQLKISGTPTFIINNHIYKGFKTYHEFRKIINKELQILL